MPEAYICDTIRTPFGRYGGALSAVRPDDLAVVPLKALLERNPELDPAAIDDVILGCANQSGEDNRNVARMALLLAGLPQEVPGSTVNRLCGSSLEAIAVAARAIKTGESSLILAGGVESMSRAPFVMAKPEVAFARDVKIEDSTLGWRFINPKMQAMYGMDSMAETAENLAEEYHIARDDQDAFAYRSQQRASEALTNGVLGEEIAPVRVPQRKGAPVIVDRDEHPRDTTLEALAKLQPYVKADGTVTAGNAAGINDGAAAVIVASEEAAKRFGLVPKARVVAAAVAGVAPRRMGMGPVPATGKVLSLAKLTLDDIDVIELNEAFAAQALAVLRQLWIQDDAPHVNPNGGAIALGHPLGASGARLVTAAVRQLQRRKGRYALCTMCIGVGQGIAMVLERV
jgi:3-oxoadipyl-CoA thiolase